MKSLAYKGGGNINLKGKKFKALSCRCCDIVNLKDKQDHQYLKRNIRCEVIDYYLDKED